MNALFNFQMSEAQKVYAIRAVLFSLLAVYAMIMFGIIGFGASGQAQEYRHFYNLTGLRFFVMLIFFLPVVVLATEVEAFISKKLGLNHDGNY